MVPAGCLSAVLTAIATVLAGPVLSQPSKPLTGASQQYMNIAEVLMANVDLAITGDADNDFAILAMPSQASAIDLAQVELRFGKDPKMRAIARQIIEGHQREIAQIARWLGEQQQP